MLTKDSHIVYKTQTFVRIISHKVIIKIAKLTQKGVIEVKRGICDKKLYVLMKWNELRNTQQLWQKDCFKNNKNKKMENGKMGRF